MLNFKGALMLIGISLGQVLATPSSSEMLQTPTSIVLQETIPSAILDQILDEAATHFQISIDTAKAEFEAGALTITRIDPNTYHVVRADGILDVVIHDLE